MTKLPDGKLAELIQELVVETEQPVVVYLDEGKFKIGVLEKVPADIDWSFAPVSAAEAEKKLGAKELGQS